MAPQEEVQQSDSTNTTPLATPSLVPPPVPVETHPNRGQFRPPTRAATDPNRLAPEDAYKHLSPPRLRPLHEITGLNDLSASAAAAALRPAIASLRAPPAIPPVAARLEQERKRNASRRRKQQPRVWKKLLWIKQHGFPDNYTDTATFLDHMQRNPRLRPYDFWPLIADSTVIVQHVCSVAIFISAYAGIYQDRLSPVAVVTCGTIATLTGWVMWDYWMGEEEAESQEKPKKLAAEGDDGSSTSSTGSSAPVPAPITANGHGNGVTNGQAHGQLSPSSNNRIQGRGLGLSLSTSNLAAKGQERRLTGFKHSQSLSKSSFQSISPIDSLSEPFPDLLHAVSPTLQSPQSPQALGSHALRNPLPTISRRNQVRLKTFKSALLIFFTLLGLSPILKSLTKSTSSDSIWALATWLLIINIFFFDYGSVYEPQDRSKSAITTKPSTEPSPIPGQAGGRLPPISVATQPGGSAGAIRPYSAPPFPSSLSTNAALMASTVLASRLSTTTSVFSLSLFSIQVFGLFPVFRRHLRYKSQELHALLSVLLVAMSSCGLFLILSQSYTHTYGDCGYCFGWIWHVVTRSVVGVFVGGFSVMFVMGACSWWLISLQRYKDVVIGPWDPARPVLTGGVSVHGRGRGGTD